MEPVSLRHLLGVLPLASTSLLTKHKGKPKNLSLPSWLLPEMHL